jgi:hypothetical protein
MAARDRIARFHADPELSEPDLTSTLEQSSDVLIEMLKERFERVVDALVQYKIGSRNDRLSLLDALFDLYDEGLLTKGEVRHRGELDPESFYNELHAYRLRVAAR